MMSKKIEPADGPKDPGFEIRSADWSYFVWRQL